MRNQGFDQVLRRWTAETMLQQSIYLSGVSHTDGLPSPHLKNFFINQLDFNRIMSGETAGTEG
jgi:hypothetical protein